MHITAKITFIHFILLFSSTQPPGDLEGASEDDLEDHANDDPGGDPRGDPEGADLVSVSMRANLETAPVYFILLFSPTQAHVTITVEQR